MQGKQLEQHKPGLQNYIGGDNGNNTPFPSNKYFKSQPVLSESARDLIHQRVAMDDEPIKVVSADLGVDHRRVAAVVRMKEIEKDWERMVGLVPTLLRLHSPSPLLSMMITHQNSISLEDIQYGYKKALRASLIEIRPSSSLHTDLC